MKVNEFDDLIYAAFTQYKFSISVMYISEESKTYYTRKGFFIYKDGNNYIISWLSPKLLKHNDKYDVSMYDYFSAEHLYLTLTNNNDIQSLTPVTMKQKILKSVIVKELFSVPNKTIISLYSTIIDALLINGAKVYLTDGVLSLKIVSVNSIELLYPVANMVFVDMFDLSTEFVNTTIQPFEDINYSLTYNTAKGTSI